MSPADLKCTTRENENETQATAWQQPSEWLRVAWHQSFSNVYDGFILKTTERGLCKAGEGGKVHATTSATTGCLHLYGAVPFAGCSNGLRQEYDLRHISRD